MREIQVYADVVLEGVTTVGYDYDLELMLCTIFGKESAVIKERKSSLCYLVTDPADVYKMLRLYYMTTPESLETFVEMKKGVVRTATVAYIPSVLVADKPKEVTQNLRIS